MKPIIRTRTVLEDEYETLYNHMKRDFPSNELAPFFAIKRNLEKKVYDGFFLTNDISNEKAEIGYAIVTAPDISEGEERKFALINYFAVLPEFRSKGHGSEFLKIICDLYSERILVIEVENPLAMKTDEQRTEALRRIKFYERTDFRILPTKKSKIFGVDMAIMANTGDNVGSVRKIMRDLYVPALGRQWLHFIDVKD